MKERPWWMYACEIIIFVSAAALLWMLSACAAGGDSPNMPISAGTATIIAVCIGGCLLVWLVVRLATGKRGGLVGLLQDILVWWTWIE